MTAFCLDIHAQYQCQHAGACCESWSVPAEPHVIDLVRAHIVRRDDVTGEMFLQDETKKWNVARDDRGDCVFFDRHHGRLCLIHRGLGSDALPYACRHFPRKIVADHRGTLISLSHFCPTAAAMLLSPGTLSVVEALPPLRLTGPIEGLDASDALPPLVRPGLLCDIDGYDAWERAGLSILARANLSFETCLAIIATATESIRAWTPGRESLAERVRASVQTANASTVSPSWSPTAAIERVRSLTGGQVGDDLTPLEAFDETWHDYPGRHTGWFNTGMKNYLGARLFANWIAYQGRGLRTIVEWLRTCAAVVGHELLRRANTSSSLPDRTSFIEAVRSADLLLLHVLDSASFAREAATIEEY